MNPALLLWLLTNVNGGSATGAIIGLDLFPLELPQGHAGPAVVYNLIHAGRKYNMNGQDGATPYRYQIDAFADVFSDLVALGAAIIADMSGFRGTVQVSPPVVVQGIFADNETDSAETGLETSGARTKRKSFDFIIWIKEG